MDKDIVMNSIKALMWFGICYFGGMVIAVSTWYMQLTDYAYRLFIESCINHTEMLSVFQDHLAWRFASLVLAFIPTFIMFFVVIRVAKRERGMNK